MTWGALLIIFGKWILRQIARIPYLRLICTAIVFIGVVIVVAQYACSGSKDSGLEKEVEQKKAEVIHQDAAAEVERKEIDNRQADRAVKSKAAKEAVEKAVEVREQKVTGIGYETSNTARCDAYPSSSECRK